MKFEFAKAMTIDTPICSVDGRLYTFGDCLNLVSRNVHLEVENINLQETIEDMKDWEEED